IDSSLKESPAPFANGLGGDTELGCDLLVVHTTGAGQDDFGSLGQLLGTLRSGGPGLQDLPLVIGKGQFSFGSAFGHGWSPLEETVPSHCPGRNIYLTNF